MTEKCRTSCSQQQELNTLSKVMQSQEKRNIGNIGKGRDNYSDFQANPLISSFKIQ